jgi:purine-nucleoside phosphorylase
MYKALIAADFKKRFNLPEDYSIGGLIAYGTHRTYPYDILQELLVVREPDTAKRLEGFLQPVLEFSVNATKYWFVVVYGGVLLSEYMHLASMFGSKANILLGSCGGLQNDENIGDLVLPTSVYAEESMTQSYAKDDSHNYYPDKQLQTELKEALEEKYKIFEGSAITNQAMLGQTRELVEEWAKEGYVAVEMESSTTFAVSGHFGIPAASVLRIGDNLVREESVFHINFEKEKGMQKQIDVRKQTARDMLEAALNALVKRN